MKEILTRAFRKSAKGEMDEGKRKLGFGGYWLSEEVAAWVLGQRRGSCPGSRLWFTG